MRKTVTRKSRLFPSLYTTLALGLACTVSLSAQNEEKSDEDVYELDAYIVSGLKESMISAQEVKLHSDQIMDTIVADDINKLPDLSVTEALQRISGIQVTRDLGEGADVSLRGLTNVTSTMNGQEVFSPQIVTGESRTMNLQTIPADMIASINVKKSPTADMIEGGIAGTIDIILRKPLDFDGDLNGNFNVRNAYSEYAGKNKIQYSAMLTDSWDTEMGEVGALISYTKQDRAARQDWTQSGTPRAYNVGTADEVVGHGGTYEPIFSIDRKRSGVLGSLQWAPQEKLRFFAEYHSTIQETDQYTWGPQLDPGSNPTATNLTKTSQTITYTRNGETVTSPWVDDMTVQNGKAISFSAQRWWYEDTKQLSAGGSYIGENLTIDAEIAYTDIATDFFYNGVFAQTQENIEYRHNSIGSLPRAYPSDSGILLDRNNLTSYQYSWTAWREYHTDNLTGSLDFTQSLGDGFFRILKYGARYSDRNAGQDENGGLYNSLAGLDPRQASNNLFAENKLTDAHGGASGKTNEFLYPDPYVYSAGSVKESWRLLAEAIGGGLNTELAATPQDQIWRIGEKTLAGYAMTNFDFDHAIRFDGNVGLRAIKTDVTTNGFQRIAGGSWQPFVDEGSYTDYLPSLNTRFFLPGENFFLRASVSRQLSRQDLSRLNSRVTLNPSLNTPGYNWTGTAGNANLEPLRTNAFDLAIEKYFNSSTSIYVSAYTKNIDGYVQSRAEIETINGELALVTRPYNVNNAKVKGYEFGYQQFFDFLPEPFNGFGINANYTYVDAKDPSGTPLQKLSKNSYNLILMYEYSGFSARIAYNWRDSFVRSTSAAGVLGTVPIVDEAFGWMDASLSYNINKNLRVQLDITNVLKVEREANFDGNSLYDMEDVYEDRMWYLSLNWKL